MCDSQNKFSSRPAELHGLGDEYCRCFLACTKNVLIEQMIVCSRLWSGQDIVRVLAKIIHLVGRTRPKPSRGYMYRFSDLSRWSVKFCLVEPNSHEGW